MEGYAPIGDYAVVGDGRTVALVALDGSIDWLCLPAFDSPPLFAAILDPFAGGHFALAPTGPFEAERRYRPDTNVLETTHSTDGGTARVTDAVNLRQGGGIVPWFELARRVDGLAGQVELTWELSPGDRFGSGRPRLVLEDGLPLARSADLQLAVCSWAAGEAEVSDGAARATFRVREGESALLVLVAVVDGPLPLPGRSDVEHRIEATAELWQQWAGAHEWEGPWREEVVRSLLALELMTETRTGAIVAAPTCSLPERIGGPKNFDYRYAWTRDTTFTLDAFVRAGRREQAQQSLTWLLDAVATTHPRVQPIYKLDGSTLRSQEQLDLPGYRRSRPVVVGNQAGSQVQLGSYGDLLETATLYARAGNRIDPGSAEVLALTTDFVAKIWRNDDSSIWEIDEAPYTFSKMACWVAFDRAIGLAEDGQLHGGRVDAWRAERDRIHAWVEERCFSEEKGAYVQAAGSDALDAAILLAARMRFLDPAGDRFRSTVEAIRAELGRGPLLYRYSGMDQEEGCFLACSFWLVEALALGGRVDDAEELMVELLALTNDVGLLSEEMDPGNKELLGNFPQGLSHLSLVNAAAAVGEAARDGR